MIVYLIVGLAVLMVLLSMLSGMASSVQVRYPIGQPWEYAVLTAQEHEFGPFNVPPGWQVDKVNVTFTGQVTDVGISAGETISQLVNELVGRVRGAGKQVKIESGGLESACLTSHHRNAREPMGHYGLKAAAYTITGTPTTATDFTDTFNFIGPFRSGEWTWKLKMKNAVAVWGAASAMAMSVSMTMWISPASEKPVTLLTKKWPTISEQTLKGACIGLFCTLSSIGSYSVDNNVVATAEVTETKRDNLGQQGLPRDGSVETTYIVFNWGKRHVLDLTHGTAQTVYSTVISRAQRLQSSDQGELAEINAGYNPL